MYIGADPEILITKKGKIIPASDAGLPDGKYNLDDRLNFGEIQIYRDGYAAEVNFIRPHTCRGNMGTYLKNGLQDFLATKVEEEIGLSTLPSAPVDLKELKRLPADVAAFGCSPSFNSWEDGASCTIELDGLKHPTRYAGGHLWFSELKGEKWWTEHILESVKLLDLHVGVPFSWLFDRPEQYRRRELYGKAGEFRVKDFNEGHYQGLEYRTLGPEWLNHSAFFSLALGSARMVLNRADSLWDHYKDFLEGSGRKIVPAAINTGADLPTLVEELTFEPFFGKGTLSRLRDDSELGQKRFDFRLFDTSEFHSGWFTYMDRFGILPNSYGPEMGI